MGVVELAAPAAEVLVWRGRAFYRSVALDPNSGASGWVWVEGRLWHLTDSEVDEGPVK